MWGDEISVSPRVGHGRQVQIKKKNEFKDKKNDDTKERCGA